MPITLASLLKNFMASLLLGCCQNQKIKKQANDSSLEEKSSACFYFLFIE
jgi:hypothetical protein